MWAVDMAVVVVLGLLAMAQISMQQGLRTLCMEFWREALTMQSLLWALLRPQIALRKHLMPLVNSFLAPQTLTLTMLINVAMTTQLLLDFFISIRGIVHFGSAGTVDDSLPLVIRISRWRADIWRLQLSREGQNLLGTIKYESLTLSSADSTQRTLWLEANSRWLSIASQLKDLELQQCVNPLNCLPNTPKVVFGKKASSADAYVNNGAYREFLYKTFNVSIVDTSSAAVAMVSLTHGLPFIVSEEFRILQVQQIQGRPLALWPTLMLSLLQLSSSLWLIFLARLLIK
ncbi:hypothetical protein GH714_020387 [Hevea brasiliensis]|uniref:Nucleoside phosphorylase domain-containing protein n=1 Tax=Hevea brasiliensis TaxID=3981 RepID=A0A6A6LZ22_HEVBR|nr:hypothetical protein GH714_020387 [Hevea brasiliensis]